MFGSSDQPFLPHYFSTRTSFIPGKEPRTPKIIMSREAFARQWLYVDIASQEIGWMGTARRLDNGDFYIEKVMLFEQACSSVETELTTNGFGSLAMELLAKGEEGERDWNNMCYWGHSHVRMHTSPSGTDENTMVKRAAGYSTPSRRGDVDLFCFQDTDLPWAIRGIFNKEGRAEFTIFLYKKGLKIIDAEWTVEDPPADATVTTGGTGKVEELTAQDLAEVSPGQAAEDERRALLSEYGVDPEDATNEDNKEGADAAETAKEAASDSEGVGGQAVKSNIPTAPVAQEPPRYWRPASSYNPRPRHPRFVPDITPALRAEVIEEIRRKVSGSYGWFNSIFGGSRQETRVYDSSSAASAYGDGAPTDGEASGPGTTGNFGGQTYSPPRTSGNGVSIVTVPTDSDTTPPRGQPYNYQLPPAGTTGTPTYGYDKFKNCQCDKCKNARRAQEQRGGYPQSWPSQRQPEEQREEGGILSAIGRFFFGGGGSDKDNKKK